MHYLADTAADLIEKGGAQAIVLAGTDLSSFYDGNPPEFPHVDLAAEHIDRVVRTALE